MNKYVLFTNFLFLFLSIIITSGVSADFFNDSLLRKNSEERIDEENHLYTTEEYTPESTEEELFEGFSSDISPPHDYTKPVITFTDSIDIDKSRVKRMRNIKGLKTDIYRFFKLDEYVKNNLEKDFNTRWMNNRKRMKQWSGQKKSGIKDLDFALPVGKAFSQIVGGETKINIDGSQKITFSGRSEWTEGQIETSYSRNSSFPSLTMKQEPRFNLRGTIGERLSLRIKQDSQMGPFSNLEENISIKYQGKDQDIIKNIDAGNTSLTLKGATFAGYRGTHKGLFGTRLESQIGPIQFTAIASQEKSEANIKSYRGSAEETSNQIRDYEYKSNTYFFIDYIYRERFANARDSFDRIQYLPSDSLVYIEVYIDDGNMINNLNDNALRGEAIPMYMENDTLNPDAAEDGYFHKADPADRSNGYYIDRSLGFIQFNRRIPNEWSVGVYIETKGGKKYGALEYDTGDENSKIQLKLIKCKQQRPTDVDTWDLEWKNVYSLGQGNFEPEADQHGADNGKDTDQPDGQPPRRQPSEDENSPAQV